MVIGSSRVMSESTSLFVAEGHLSRRNEPEGSSLILAGESFPVLVGGDPLFVSRGSFFVMIYCSCRVMVEDSGILSSWDR